MKNNIHATSRTGLVERETEREREREREDSFVLVFYNDISITIN